MCGRFTLTADLQEIAERFGVPTASPDAYAAASPAGERQREGEHASQRRGYTGGAEGGRIDGRRPPLQGESRWQNGADASERRPYQRQDKGRSILDGGGAGW